jgi:hypothetical protein
MPQQIGNQPWATASGMPNPMGTDRGMREFYQACAKPEILETFRCATFVNELTSRARLQGLLREGTEYTYMRMSDPIVHRGYDFNSEFASPDTPKGAECKIRLGYHAYVNEKLDPMVLRQMTGTGREAYRSDRNMRAGQVLAQTHQDDFLCWLASQVHPCNEGNNAGVASGTIDLGTIENPFVMNPRNSLALFTLLDQTLNEHNLPRGNRRVVIPAPIKTQLALSVGRAIANTGRGMGEYLNGLCSGFDMLPCGDQVYVTNCIKPVKNTSNKLVFPVYYLWKDAIDAAYGMVDEYSGIFKTDGVRSVYSVERQFITYGFSTIYCQGVARAWVTVDANWQDKLPGGSCA